jgi:hypothetical protein
MTPYIRDWRLGSALALSGILAVLGLLLWWPLVGYIWHYWLG